jgi:membrane protease YdiL (CAAX protease family)
MLMTEESEVPVNPPELNKRVLFTPHSIALITMWLLTTVTMIVMLANGVRNTGQFRVERYILQVAYVLALIWYLIRTGPSVKKLPDLSPLLLPKLRIGKWIPVIVLALLLLSEFYDQGILRPLLMLATIWILIVWRREIGLTAVLLGLAITTIALLGGLPFYQNQAFGKVVFILFLLFVTPMFVAGGLFSKRTGLVGSQLYTRRYRKAVVSFLRGCVLFIPLGLINAAAGAPDLRMTWVDRWWIPFSQPWFSAIVEETWFRLFLVSLCYFLLRPAFSKRPAIALGCAVLFSAITFGLGHGGTLLENLLITGLLFGLPMAVVFARRDWEHAVGAHYMINMIPTLMVFLET